MKSCKLVKICSLLGAMFISSAASAGQIIDIVNQNVGVNLLNPMSYQHDINDDGFVHGSALDASLSINIYDNADFLGEGALIIVEGFNFDTGGTWGALFFSAAPGWANDLGIQALAALNDDGFLHVAVSGVGNFWVGDSTLTVNYDDALAAPEPGMLSLIGLSLFGLAGVSRRRRQS